MKIKFFLNVCFLIAEWHAQKVSHKTVGNISFIGHQRANELEKFFCVFLYEDSSKVVPSKAFLSNMNIRFVSLISNAKIVDFSSLSESLDEIFPFNCKHCDPELTIVLDLL